MTNLVYLGIAVVLSALGSLVLWMRHRKPRSMEAHMQRFARELEALAPDPEWNRRAHRRRQREQRAAPRRERRPG
ncbi:MAG: hypothetical protein JO265_00755 [Acidimicrobiia bacterium]|nr:hypothetical protein [Acidimicrobiia bacterium]